MWSREGELARLVPTAPIMLVCVCVCSDIVVQIVDARNPLLFRCEDLVSTSWHMFLPLACNMCLDFDMCLPSYLQEKYVKELSPEKVNMVLISKADLLTPRQRWVCLVLITLKLHDDF